METSVLLNLTRRNKLTLHFLGSPSFIADGRDLFPSAAAPALSCRVYLGADGMSGLPSQEDFQAALRSRTGNET